MADNAFEHPRLAGVYDALEADRRDLEVYAGIAAELGATTVLDLGCGTGTFALLLAERGFQVTGADPALASLAVARAKPDAGLVDWVHGAATALPPLAADLATMTGNVAQAIDEPADWDAALDGIHAALRPDGHLVFETRDPADRAWERWTRAATHHSIEIEGAERIERWQEVTQVNGP